MSPTWRRVVALTASLAVAGCASGGSATSSTSGPSTSTSAPASASTDSTTTAVQTDVADTADTAAPSTTAAVALPGPGQVRATDPAPPDQAFFDAQVLEPGFGYVTARDGVTLSANVTLPGPVENGPYPTVVEYSGYAPSNPGDTTFAQLFTTLGYAYVGVNMRGSGCSGGTYSFFDPVQSMDGYDVIETVAAQPWVKFHEVGMVGISYPGISQLFVAQTQPPHLAAITPLSVLDDAYRATLYPGGILNTGFAVAWATERQNSAKAYGQEWTVEQAKTDTVCADNQKLRGGNQDLLGMIQDNPYYDPAIGDLIAPRTFVQRIDVPVFLAGAWQDEQTGGHFATMLDRFTGSPHVYASLVNGLHTESLISLGIFGRYVEFLDLYVARRAPDLTGAAQVAPILAGGITGVAGLSLPARRSLGTTYEAALAAFEAEAPIEVLFEEGAADGQPAGSPVPRFSASFDAWPVTDRFDTWYLGDDGLLSDASAGTGSAGYVADPTTSAINTLDPTADEWAADVVYDWEAPAAANVVAWVSPALTADTVVVGSGWVTLNVSASTGDTDLEATLSEVRPDGTEVYVQNGWLRLSHRVETPDSPPDGPPLHTDAVGDAASDPAGELVEARLELFPVAHAFRSGSRIRLTIDAPGGNRPSWAFDTIADGEQVTISTSATAPSALVLPVVDGIAVPTGLPACGSLRGQPCRPYVG